VSAGVARVKAAKTGAGLWVGSVKAARPTEGYKTQSDKLPTRETTKRFWPVVVVRWCAGLVQGYPTPPREA
jgi:hypothetical protein